MGTAGLSWLRALHKERLGRVLADPAGRAVYASDASVFRVLPAAVLQPRGPDELRRALEIAADAQVPVTARGAGSSRAGQALGEGLIVDLSVGLQGILSLDPERRRARVQPGVVLADLQRAAAAHGLFFPPDPSSGAFCTLGGMVGNNAGGPRSLRYGSVRDHLRSAVALLPGGDPLRFAPDHWPAGPLREVVALLVRERATLQSRPVGPTKTSSGYGLPRGPLAPDAVFNPVELLAGSEGTLALATELELDLSVLPSARATLVIALGGLSDLQDAVCALRAALPSKIELVDRALLELAAPAIPGVRRWLRRPFGFLLLVEAWEHGRDALEQRLAALRAAVGGDAVAQQVRSSTEQDRLWALRAAAVGYLARHPGAAKPLPILEDPCVPPHALHAFVAGLQSLLSTLQLRAFVFGHAGDGNLHINVLIDPRRADHRRGARELLVRGHALVAALGGSLSGEHGDGRLRTPFLPQIFGALHERVHRPLKAIFDRHGLFNPGVIVANPAAPAPPRVLEGGRHRAPTSSLQELRAGPIESVWQACHGCGRCRTFCPPARSTGREELSSRARSSLLRELSVGEWTPEASLQALAGPIVDACLACGACALDCPSGVDVALAVRDVRAGLARRGRLTASARLMAAVDRHGARLAALPGPLRALARSGPARWMAELVFDLDSTAPLPRPLQAPLSQQAAPPSSAPADTVIYYPGCQALWDAEGEGAAVLSLLSAAGLRASVPDLACCGLPAYVQGLPRRAELRTLGRRLMELSEGGVQVVFSAPSCQLMLRREAAHLVPDGPWAALSERCVDVLELLEARAPDLPLAPRPGRLAYHHPCHARRLRTPALALAWLRRIPGLEVIELSQRCCGRGGTWGLKRQHRALSREVGQAQVAELRAAGVAGVVSPCGACRSQLGELAGLPTYHPAQLVAAAAASADADSG